MWCDWESYRGLGSGGWVCPNNKAVVGACTSGGLADCGEGKISHYVDCSTESLVDVPVETDWSDTDWIDVDFEFGVFGSRTSNTKKAWERCPPGEAIFSRCASGRFVDCWLPNHSHHGIKCGKLSEIYVGFLIILTMVSSVVNCPKSMNLPNT